MSRLFFFCCALIALLVLGCGGPGVAAPSLSGKEAEMHETGAASLLAGSKAYALKWADTEAAAELRQQLPKPFRTAEDFDQLDSLEENSQTLVELIPDREQTEQMRLRLANA